MSTMAETTADLAAIIRSGDYVALKDELVRWRPTEIAAALIDRHCPCPTPPVC
jgi:hypothetical protein